MRHTPMTRHEGSLLVKLIVVGMLIQLAVIVYTFYSSYQGRADQVVNSRAGCERSKLDRVENARGWRAAQMARMNAVADDLHIPLKDVRRLIEREPKPGESSDLVAAREYHKIASGQEARSRIACSEAFPKAGLFQ